MRRLRVLSTLAFCASIAGCETGMEEVDAAPPPPRDAGLDAANPDAGRDAALAGDAGERIDSGRGTRADGGPLPEIGLPTIALGDYHTCVLRAGVVRCVGRNDDYQLGDGHVGLPAEQLEHVTVPGIDDAVTIAASTWHTCIVRATREVVCWGGEIGALGGSSSGSPGTVEGLDDAVAIALSSGTSCAVRAGGAVVCWGSGGAGGLGDGTLSPSRPIPGANASGIDDATQIAGGTRQTSFCATRAGGAISCWGVNMDGELGTEESIERTPADSAFSPARAIALGQRFVCAANETGEVRCAGRNNAGQLGDGTTEDRDVPVLLALPRPAIALAAGSLHACAVLDDRTVWCWGNNSNGQLGDGTTERSLSPSPVLELDDVVEIEAGALHTCALRADGEVLCWGDNQYGQLGDRSGEDRWLPAPMVDL